MRQKLALLCKEDVLTRIVLICLGCIVNGIGNAICIQTGLGADPLNVLYQGTAIAFQVSEGMASLIVSGVMILVVLILCPRELGAGTILSLLVFSFGFDLGMAIVPECPWFPVNYGVMLLGLCVIALGLALTIYANFGKGAYDALIFSFIKKTKLEYYKIRWGLDLLFLVTGVLLGGKMTPATIIAVLVTGKIITFFVRLLRLTNLVKV